jgi:V8-like Glu-specific endopeptidase
MTKNKKMGAGSGTLISSNLVLTAAHNLYDKE